MNRPDETGASAVEYGLMLAAITAVIVFAVFGLGSVVNELFTRSTSCLSAQSNSGC